MAEDNSSLRSSADRTAVLSFSLLAIALDQWMEGKAWPNRSLVTPMTSSGAIFKEKK
jgi:hypothetical protein